MERTMNQAMEYNATPIDKSVTTSTTAPLKRFAKAATKAQARHKPTRASSIAAEASTHGLRGFIAKRFRLRSDRSVASQLRRSSVLSDEPGSFGSTPIQ